MRYSPQHGHRPGPGPWFVESFTEQLQTMRAKSRPLNPDMILGFEGAGVLSAADRHPGLPRFRGQLESGALECKPASVFTYLYHEFVPFFQSNPEGFQASRPAATCSSWHTAWWTGRCPTWCPIGPFSRLLP